MLASVRYPTGAPIQDIGHLRIAGYPCRPDVRCGSRLGSRVTQSRLPLFPHQQTFLSPAVTSEKCHVWTAPVWQELSSRFCSIGRCSHVFGLLMRFPLPLAIMPSADRVPTNTWHSRMPWHMWVVLLAGSTGSALAVVCPPNRDIS